jgi:hypothetical protein
MFIIYFRPFLYHEMYFSPFFIYLGAECDMHETTVCVVDQNRTKASFVYVQITGNAPGSLPNPEVEFR